MRDLWQEIQRYLIRTGRQKSASYADSSELLLDQTENLDDERAKQELLKPRPDHASTRCAPGGATGAPDLFSSKKAFFLVRDIGRSFHWQHFFSITVVLFSFFSSIGRSFEMAYAICIANFR